MATGASEALGATGASVAVGATGASWSEVHGGGRGCPTVPTIALPGAGRGPEEKNSVTALQRLDLRNGVMTIGLGNVRASLVPKVERERENTNELG